MAKKTVQKVDVEQRLLALTGAKDGVSALALTERVLTVASQQSYFLNNMGVVTLVVGPQGLGYFNASPNLTNTVEGLAIVEQALLDLQKHLIEQRKKVMAAPAKEE